MSDNPTPEPAPPAEAGTSTTVTNVSGGVNLDAQHDVNIGDDVVGRDRTTTNVNTGGGAYIAGNVNVAIGGKFVGREAELAELMSKAETDGVTISGLQGMGGTGKTVLVLVQTDFSLTLTQYGHRMSSN